VRGAIIAAGGPSRRMRQVKPFVPVAGVPLVQRVARVAAEVADEVVVVTRPPHSPALRSLLAPAVRVLEDETGVQSPLVGFVTGAAALASEHVAFLACDLPLLSPRVLGTLFDTAMGHDAAVPRWPDGRIEPMVAVYRRTPALAAARAALSKGSLANTDMIEGLADALYVRTEDLRPADPGLDSFVNVNTPADVRAAEARIRKRRASPP
jgi:molybdenum cofactor guanylyltransferase